MRCGLRKYQRGIICAVAVYGEAIEPLSIDAGANVSAAGSGPSACGNPGNTGITNAAASGGAPPYDYLWTIDDTPATKGPWVPSSTTDPTTVFGGSSNVCEGEDFAEVWRITVTDDDLNTDFDTITVIRRWTNTS